MKKCEGMIMGSRSRLAGVLLCFSLLLSVTAAAEVTVSDSLPSRKTQFSVALSGHGAYLLPKGDHNKRVLHSYGVGYADLRLQWRQLGSGAYDQALHHPTLEVGLLYGDYTHIHMQDPDASHASHVGREWALYGGLQYDIWQHGAWRAGMDVQNGLAYFTERFDPNRNPDNELIGSPLSVYIGLGGYVARRLAPQWELALAVNFKHVSNGTLNRPNLGANTIGPELRLAYSPKVSRQADPYAFSVDGANGGGSPSCPSEEVRRGAYLELSAGISGSTLRDQFATYRTNDNPLYGSFIAMAAPMWRYHQLMASGVEVNYIYATYADHIRFYDELEGHDGYDYSRHVLGVGVRHEFFYRHVSLHMGAGAYLYRHMGHRAATADGGSYQTVGLRYNVPSTGDRLFIGYNVKAHNFSKADCMQLSIGYRLPVRK